MVSGGVPFFIPVRCSSAPRHDGKGFRKHRKIGMALGQWVHLHRNVEKDFRRKKSGLKRGVVNGYGFTYMQGKVWGKVVLREEWSLLVHLHEGKGLEKGGLKRGVVLTGSFT